MLATSGPGAPHIGPSHSKGTQIAQYLDMQRPAHADSMRAALVITSTKLIWLAVPVLDICTARRNNQHRINKVHVPHDLGQAGAAIDRCQLTTAMACTCKLMGKTDN